MKSPWVWSLLGGAFGASLLACTPGYMKAADLERKEQGPSHCAARCEELGMRMGALVLVGDDLPGCVCQPLIVQGSPQATRPVVGPSPEGASAATTGYVVLAAAAAAQRQQQQQQQYQYHAPH